jgi:peptidoglycan-associated lipoprotein
MMTSKVNIAITVTLALFLTACGGSSAIKGDEAGGEGTTAGTTGSAAGGAETGAAGGSGAEGQALGGDTQVAMAAQQPDKLRVHFEFDSSAIDSESRGIIEQHAAYLAANPDIKINLTGHADERGTREYNLALGLTGHADERGTREYNLALGERRGVSVERMLRVLGITTDRVTTISYGEEQPLAMGHEETSWRVNRRVEFIYKN